MAQRTDRIRVAISGYGWIARHRHAPCFKREGAELVAAYRPVGSVSENGMAVVEEFDDLFEYSPDVVSICSPPWAHAEQAIKALEHGCHVVVEKPMAMNAAEAEEMVKAAHRTGKALTVAHSHLYDRAMIRAAQMLESGMVGELTSVHALFFRGGLPAGKPWLFELPGGLVFDELPHPVYLMERFLGPVTVRSLDVEPVPGRNTPRQVHAALEGQRATGHISVVMDSPVSEWHLVLTGTKQMLVVDLFRDVLVSVPSDRAHAPTDVMRTSLASVTGHVMGVLSSGLRYALGRLYYGHDVLIQQFLESVRTGAPLPVTPEEALRTQRLVDQIIQPASERQPSSAD